MRSLRSCLVGGAVLLLGPGPGWTQDTPPAGFPARVLITNDNGIDDPKIVALARAFSERSEVWVVAPADDRSGSSNYFSVTSQGFLEIERRQIGPGIQAFAVDGYPADCMLLALAGLMRESPPDLVVSGINGGANPGADWFGSGTVGAARVAALAGIPSLAVSGLDDDLPGAVEATVDWVVGLASTDLVRDLEPLRYLTVSLPRTVPDSIRGVRVTDRAPLMFAPRLEAKGENLWRLVGIDTLSTVVPFDSDQAALNQGYIAVVPMRVDEVDLELLARWRRERTRFPTWP